MEYNSVSKANSDGNRADQLRALSIVLAENIDTCDDTKLLPQLARQYRETIRELSEIDTSGTNEVENIIGNIAKVR